MRRQQLPEDRGAAEESFSFRRAPISVPFRRGPGDGAWFHDRASGGEPHPQGRPHGSEAAGDAQVQHGQVRNAEPGHVAHLEEGSGALVDPQHRAEAVREVHLGVVSRHGLGVAVQAETVGQADGEGPRQLQKDARLGLRRKRGDAVEVVDTKKR